MFVDRIRIQARAGSGGNGCVSFRREAFVPRGGPDGGDGGRGGSIILRADTHTDSLTSYFYEPILRARSGEHGKGKQCYGKSSVDRVYAVPVGTLVFRLPFDGGIVELEPSVRHGTDALFVDLEKSPEDPEPDECEVDVKRLELLVDLDEVGKEFVLCRGGRGGLGNVHFKSSRNRVPTQFTHGEEGEAGVFFLELRKIADVGLVGFPNAGKSTILSRISAARPKVASYPFTTLTPHIGVVEANQFERFTVADIPGLIDGAHLNVGLGHEFLRHIVRCKLLAFVVDVAGSEGRDPVSDIESLRRELDLYDPILSRRPWVILANKTDLLEECDWISILKNRFDKVEVFPMSASESIGVESVKSSMATWVKSLGAHPGAGEQGGGLPS